MASSDVGKGKGGVDGRNEGIRTQFHEDMIGLQAVIIVVMVEKQVVNWFPGIVLVGG